MVKDNHAPIPEGLDLVRSLGAAGRVTVLAEASVNDVERFLAVWRVEPIARVVSGSQRPGDSPLLVRQVEECRANEMRLDTVVVPDPGLVTPLLKSRLAVVLFLAPGSTPPKYRPDDDDGRRTWESISRDISERTY